MQWQDVATFSKVSAVLNLPPTYVSALYHASGHAETSIFMKEGQKNECVGFLAQNTDYNWNPWSLGLCYDPATGITTGILCAEEARKINVNAITEELKHELSPSTHPALLPVIMFERLLHSSFNHYSRLHEAMCVLEQELGRDECKGCSLEEEDIKYGDWRRRLHVLQKQQASRDGRHQFWRHFHDEIQNLFVAVAETTRLEKLKYEQLDLRNRVRTIFGKFESLEGRDVNSKAWIDAQFASVCLLPPNPVKNTEVHVSASPPNRTE